MKISVRPVNHDSEKQELLGILQTNLPHQLHDRRFKWLYRANPDGPAWSWFAFQAATGQVVGIASVFPRAMWIGNDLRRCGQVGDFAISSSHRSLGPAVLLQRSTFEPVDQGEIAFCYDCPPHEAGMSTFRRLGMPANCGVDRYAIPLRVESLIRRRLGFASALPAAAGNLLLRLHRWPKLKLGARGLEVSEFTGVFEEEFSRLDMAVKKEDVIRGQRSASHLNWRYRNDPLRQYQVWTVRRKGELFAFMVFFTTNEVVTIVDLFGVHLDEVGPALLAALIERYQRSHQTIEAFLSEGNELSGLLTKMGFGRRSEAARVVAYAQRQGEISKFLQGSPTWSFSKMEVQA
jgi:hypothetical protein